MSTKADALRQQLRDKVDARTLDQVCTELQLLAEREYTPEVAIVSATYHRSLEARFPELSARAWKIDEENELANPNEFTPFIDSIMQARKELGI